MASGAAANNVLSVLFQQKMTVRNYGSDLRGYLDWALNTAQLLRNQIRQGDIDRLIFTPRLWRLQELTGTTTCASPTELLSIELQEKSELFERVHATLKFADESTPAGGRRLLGWTTGRHWLQEPAATR